VVKYSATGALDWKKILGGAGNDYGYGITIGAVGTVYVTGRTNSLSTGVLTCCWHVFPRMEVPT